MYTYKMLLFFPLLPVCGSKFNQPASCCIHIPSLSVALASPFPLLHGEPHTGSRTSQKRDVCCRQQGWRAEQSVPTGPKSPATGHRPTRFADCLTPFRSHFAQNFPPYVSILPFWDGKCTFCALICWKNVKSFKNFTEHYS